MVRCSAGDAGGAGSEDCLKVNIYAPYGAKEGDNRKRNLLFLEVDSMYHVMQCPCSSISTVEVSWSDF